MIDNLPFRLNIIATDMVDRQPIPTERFNFNFLPQVDMLSLECKLY